MRNQIKFLAVTAMLSLPVSLFAANSDWYNPKSWFSKNKNVSSTTVTGNVESIQNQVIFKTLDGQTLLLIGNKAAKVGECGTSSKIRVFGNVYKPSDKYPTGALQVRNFRVLESAETPEPATTPTEPVPTSSPADINTAEVSYEEATPEPYEEPTLDTTQESTSNIPSNVITAVDQEETVEPYVEEEDEEETPASTKTYVVQGGDTLGKISSKFFGTTAKWKKIAEYNNITNPKHLKVGMTLNIPEL